VLLDKLSAVDPQVHPLDPKPKNPKPFLERFETLQTLTWGLPSLRYPTTMSAPIIGEAAPACRGKTNIKKEYHFLKGAK
jgi:hypothetical protein